MGILEGIKDGIILAYATTRRRRQANGIGNYQCHAYKSQVQGFLQ
jgi:hypothetical protein